MILSLLEFYRATVMFFPLLSYKSRVEFINLSGAAPESKTSTTHLYLRKTHITSQKFMWFVNKHYPQI
jgi:hypothetical protein